MTRVSFASRMEISAKRSWTTAIAVTASFWLPLLALNLGYPSVEEILATPVLRSIAAYSIAACVILIAIVAVPTAFAAHLAARAVDRNDLCSSGAFCGSASGSALVSGFVAILALRASTAPLGREVLGIVFVLVIAGAMGALIGALAVFEAHRGGRSWVPVAIALLSAGIWAHITRILIHGTPAMDEPFSTWLVAGGASLIGIGFVLGGRRQYAAVLAALVMAAAGSLPAMHLRSPRQASAFARPDSKHLPNVVIVLIDTWRFDVTDLGGVHLGTTPRLDALAADGRSTVFDAAESSAPSTIPSVKALFTGRPASSFGLQGWGNHPPPSTAWTLPRAFEAAGYSTSAFIANDLVKSGGFERGFNDFWCVGASGNLQRSFFLQVVLARLGYWRVQRLAETLGVMKTRGDSLVGAFDRWIDQHPNGPLFSYIHLVEPHWPYHDHGYGFVPERLRHLAKPFSHIDLEQLTKGDPANAKYRRMPQLVEMKARYEEEVRDADRIVGRVVDSLSERKLLDDTILILVGDHGEEFFEHNGYGHGQDVYEELTHVPLVVHWPTSKRFEAMPPRIGAPVSLIDVFPTLTGILGLRAPSEPFAGRSLEPLLEDRPEKPAVISETLYGLEARLAYREGDLVARFVFDPRSLPSRATNVSVFDLSTDPHELSPLSGERTAPVLAAAKGALDPWWERARNATPRSFFARMEHGPKKNEALDRLRALGYLQ